MRGLTRVGTAVAVMLATAALAATSAGAATTTGWDISYPQCNGAFPTPSAFAVVGVNSGKPYSANPCLGTGDGASELQWAGMSAGLYANTADPGHQLSTHWPTGQTAPKLCDGTDSLECAYDYGWNAAADSYQDAVNAYVALGWAPAGSTRTPVANDWWLDVESANSWLANTAVNVAELQGEADYMGSVGAASVGFYANASDWQTITGSTTAFATYRSWVPGAGSLSQAQTNCGGAGITGGGVALAQYLSNGFDGDLSCAQVPALTFATGPQTLTAGGASSAAQVTLPAATGAAVDVTLSSSFASGRFSASAGGPWSSTLVVTVPAGATTSPSFYYEDTKAGSPLITAQAQGYSDASQTETVRAAALASIAVSPASARVRPGGKQTFTASGADSYGNTVAVSPTWTVSPTSLGSFSPAQGASVTFTAGSTNGSGAVTAQAGAVQGQASVTVSKKPH